MEPQDPRYTRDSVVISLYMVPSWPPYVQTHGENHLQADGRAVEFMRLQISFQLSALPR